MDEITICVVAYNRPNSLKRLLKSLEKANYNGDKVRLYISIDRTKEADKKNLECQIIANEYKWPYGEKIVQFRKENMGLRKHILSCGDLTSKYENIIILEDDIYVFPFFYQYAKQALNFYKNDDRIAGFGLYSYFRHHENLLPFYPYKGNSDVYFMQFACSWGQMWTKKQWDSFKNWYYNNNEKDLHNINFPDYIAEWKESSWLKYYMKYVVDENKYFVYPYNSCSTNFNDVGTHNKGMDYSFQTNVVNQSNNKNYCFESIDQSFAVYDCFFENMKMNQIISFENVECDFYQTKKQYTKKYVLTTKKLNYKIVKKYALLMYPYEQNIINSIEGNELYLYDTTINEKNLTINSNYIPYLYKIGYMEQKVYSQLFQYLKLYGKRFKFRKTKELIKSLLKNKN